jgi:hypothetical protein
MTAKMNMTIPRTKVRFDNAPTVFAMIVRMSLRDFQDFANLKTLNSRKERSTDNPLIPSASNSTKERSTMVKSNTFQPLWKKIQKIRITQQEETGRLIFYPKEIFWTHSCKLCKRLYCKNGREKVVSLFKKVLEKRRPSSKV